MRRRSDRSATELFRLLETVSAAGLGERRWTDALGAASAFFGSAGASIFDVDRLTGAVPDIYTFGLGDTQGDYAQRMNAINPRMRRALAQPGPHTACDYTVLPEAAMRRHEFYDWLGRECGVKYHIGSRMIDEGDISSFVSVEFAPGHGHPERREIELFRLVSQHIANAWRLSRGVAQLDAVTGLHEALQETLPWGVFGLDRRGRVLSVSRRARAVLARHDGLALDKGHLRALRAAEDRTLNIVLAHQLRSIAGDGLCPGGVVAISRRDGGPPYVLRIMPIMSGGSPPSHSVAILVVLSDPERVLPRAEDLRAIFGLTAREAELARLLVGGGALKDAAARLKMAHNTARVHLANIMLKTGTHSQAALVALLRSLPMEMPDA